MRVLICGHRSYAARGLREKLVNAGLEVFCFSRGEEHRDGFVITGSVTEMDSNRYLKDLNADAVVNFILLNGQSVEDNLKYIDSLCNWCKREAVKRIVHISSVSALPNDNDAEIITEATPVDPRPELKGNYGAVKTVTENRLVQWRKAHNNHQLSIVRAGFITAPDKKKVLAGIVKMFPLGFAVLMGNSKSTLPMVERDELHLAIIDAIVAKEPLGVYLMVNKEVHTKKEYLKTIMPDTKVIPLPKWLTLSVAGLLKTFRFFDERRYRMVAGLFKVQTFNNDKTYGKIHKMR